MDGLDFSETDLVRVELIGANLAGIKLERGDLTRVNLTSACIDGAKIWGPLNGELVMTPKPPRSATLCSEISTHTPRSSPAAQR